MICTNAVDDVTLGPRLAKGTKPHQLWPLTRQFNFLRESVRADSSGNFKELASHYAKNSLKFKHKSAQPFSCKKLKCLVKFENS